MFEIKVFLVLEGKPESWYFGCYFGCHEWTFFEVG